MGSYESFSGRVEDDGSPARALNVAGQAVRDFNHRSNGRLGAGRPGWQFPADVGQALGALSYLADGLPQAVEQIIRALRGQLDQGGIKIDAGTEWEGDPAGAVEAVSVGLRARHPGRPPDVLGHHRRAGRHQPGRVRRPGQRRGLNPVPLRERPDVDAGPAAGPAGG